PPSRPAATTAAAAARATAAGGGGAAGSAGSAAGAGGAGGATGSAGGAAGAGGAGPTTDSHCLSWPLSRQLQRLGVDSGGHCLSRTTPPLNSFASGFFSERVQVVEALVFYVQHRGGNRVAALGASESAAALGASESAAALGASESAAALGARASPATGPSSAEALHTFTLDSGVSRCFFRDCTTLTPLAAPVPVSLADPTGGLVVARASTVLPCLAVPSGSLLGLHLPTFSTNLVSNAAIQDIWVDAFIRGGQRVAICTCSRTGRHLATFTRRPGSSLYTLTTASAQVAEAGQVAASSQVSASGQLAASCSCRVLSHQTLLWHFASVTPTYRVSAQSAAPQSSDFPPTTVPLLTLHIDADVSSVLIPWIRATHRQLRELFSRDFPVLRLHSDRGDSGASSCFFRECTDLTPLRTPFTVALGDPSVGLVVAHSTTTLSCPPAPSEFLTGYYTPSFSRNLVGVSHLYDLGVVTTFPVDEPVASCTVGTTGAPLATFHRELSSGLYSLHTGSHHTGSGQVRSGQVAAVSYDCWSLTHLSILWHHRLGHPSFPRLHKMACHRLRAAPHSSFPPTTAPFHTLHLDVWGPSPVLGPHQECYFLIVVDDYSRYTTVFPLRRKADVPTVLEPWLLAWGGAQGLCELRLHSDYGGEFSFTRLETFCEGRGIIKSYMLLALPQQNRVADRRIGLVMEVARTSMCHAVAPQFLWPQAVRNAAHPLNLWPSDTRPRVTTVFLWTGSLGVAAGFRVWGSLVLWFALRANKLSPRTLACVFLGFPLDVAGWVFYDPLTDEFFSSLDVMFDEFVCYYRSRPHRGVSHVTPQSSPLQRPVPVVSGGAGGAVVQGEGTEAAGAGGVGSAGAGVLGVEFPPRSSLRLVAVEPGGIPAGGTGGPGGVSGGGACAGGAGAGGTGTVAPTPRTVRFLTREQRLLRLEREEREQFEWALQQQQQQQEEQSQTQLQESIEEESQLQQERAEELSRLQQQVQVQLQQERVEEESWPHQETSRGVTAAAGEGGAGFLVAAVGAAATAAGEGRGRATGAATGASTAAADARGGGAAETASARPSCCVSRAPSVRYHADGPFHLVLRSCVPPPLVLPQPPESSLTVLHDPLSDYIRASRPVVSRVLSALVTHPTAPLSPVSYLVTTIAGFVSSHRLDYAAHPVSGPARSSSSGGAHVFPLEVLEDRQFELGFLEVAVPHLCAMLLALEGDPNALDISIPRTDGEAVSGPWASYWIVAEEAEMSSYRSTGTYIDAVSPSGTNVVSGRWLYKVKRPRGSPPVFKACYVARGFRQREGVDFFQTFAPTPKMTTLRVLLHIAAQRDYELHSLDFSTAFLQGSLHEQIWLRRPPGSTGSIPLGTQWQLR
ncbi:unnamed protein product, partial [Closterium sp. NIES-54]